MHNLYKILVANLFHHRRSKAKTFADKQMSQILGNLDHLSLLHYFRTNQIFPHQIVLQYIC